MNITGKNFRNNKTGETVKVIDAFENIAILENKEKVDVRALMDTNKFTEQIDPSSFFNNQNSYKEIAEKIKTLPIDNIIDESIGNKFGGEFKPSINESAIIETTEEYEMAELARKYGVNTNNEDGISKQNKSFEGHLNTGKSTFQQPVTRIDIDNNPQVESIREYEQPVQQRIQDPIVTMFKSVKRNIDFNISIEVSNKIPRIDFIEMMEDSYETSIIEFLADEFTNQVLDNPSQIKETIKKEIITLVYGTESPETVNKKDDQSPNEDNKKKEEVKKGIKSKKTVKERTYLISKLNSISSIESQLKDETSKTVISAANKRIKELKNNTK